MGMENPTVNKGHLPCQSWMSQNGWSTTSTPGPVINSVASSQHFSLGSSSQQRPSYDHLQSSNQNSLSDLSTLTSTNGTHHSVLHKASQISNDLSSNTLFADTSVPSASPFISCAQQSIQTLQALLTANQQNAIPPQSLPQTNQAVQNTSPQNLPPLSTHDPYKASFRPPPTNQGLPSGLQDLPVSLTSCGQGVSTSQDTLGGTNVESTGIAGYSHSYGPSTSQEQPQWVPSLHCMGATIKPDSDSAIHPNNEPSQENVLSQGNDEIWRSVLLNHRAQLLKQLAELDKLLASIPPGDSSDVQSLATAIQSPPSMDESSHCEPTKSSSTGQVQLTAETSTTQSSHSEDGLSTAACDEHDETCDMTEEPMSEGESEKMQHTSAESGDDTDPDYIPMSDGDLSCDLQSDRDSSDESIHSCSSTRTDEKPPLTLKKKARLESTSSKDERTKKSPGAAVLATSNSKKHRVYDKRNYCLFCSKPLAKMSRHLERVHSDKIEVAVAFQYPVNSKERHKIWSKLINQGNFVHNKQVMKTGKGQLVVRKRSYITGEAKDFLHCLYCRGLYLKKNLYRHIRLCPEKAKNENESQIGRKRIASRCALETLGDLGVSEGFRTVLCEMIYDDITQTVMDDKIILQFGEHMYIQQGSDARKHEYIRQNVRQIARLVLEAQKITPLNNLQDFFNPSGFQHAVSAVKVLAGYNPEKKTFSIPSLALKLGYHLQKACSIVEDNAVKSGDESLAESARNFLSLYQKKWNEHISSGALTSLKETKVITAKKVPFAQDVKCLNFHLEKAHVLAEKKLRDNPSVETYAVLAKVILARTIIFNRRKPGEVSAIKLKSFMQRKMSNVLDGMDISVSDLERAMCRLFARVDIRGSCGRLVPVILKPSFVSAMELLVEVRETCGIPSKNPFLFARPSALTPYKGSECVQHYVRECGAQSPEALTSRKIRKHYATMLQMLNLDEEEANQILGPNNQVHTLQQINDMQMDGVQINSEVKLQQAASWRHTEVSGSRCQQDFIQQQHGVTAATNSIVSLNSVNSNSKGSQNKGKQKWVGAEVHAVERHMMRFIRGHKVPQKNDCIQCLEAEPKALRARSWKGVKDYVRNRITALKRQSGTSTNLNRPGQAEPQKSAERFQQL